MDRSKYFFRTAVFTREDDQVILLDLTDPNGANPLDDWLGTVVSLADGHHTITDLIGFLSSQYPAGPPDTLGENIESMIEHLMSLQAIQLSEEPVVLPYYLALPANEQDMEKARQLIIEDGFIKP